MGYLTQLVFIIGLIYLVEQGLGLGLKEPLWNYEILTIEITVKDESKVKFELEKELVSRGVYALSGYLENMVPVDDSVEVEVKAWRSADGSAEYKILPFSINKQGFSSFINGYYKDLLMKSLKSCSNFLQFEGKWKPPLPPKKYTFDQCQISNEKFPQYMQDGYYRIIGTASNALDLQIKIEARIAQYDS